MLSWRIIKYNASSSPFNVSDPDFIHKCEMSGICAGKHGSGGCLPTTKVDKSDTFILRIISFSHHRAVVQSWKFEASVWWSDAHHDANPLRIREEPLGTGNLLIGRWILNTMMLIDSQS